MNRIAWETEYSVEVDESSSFAWDFMTDLSNWDDPPATFTLNGPFVAGARGATHMPGREPVEWLIRDVQIKKSFVLETQVDRAVLAFFWLFEPLSDQATRLTQRIVLSGANAEAIAKEVAAGFGSNLAAGMQRIADQIAAASK